MAEGSQSGSAKQDSETASDPTQALSFGQSTLKISQLRAQIHRLESRLDSSSESSSDEEQDVRNGWLSAKAESLTLEVARLQTEAADAQGKHTAAMQVIISTLHIHVYIYNYY